MPVLLSSLLPPPPRFSFSFFSFPFLFWKRITGCKHCLWLAAGLASCVVHTDFMIYSANGKGAWPPVATERELHVDLMLSPQKCLLWLSCVAEVTVWMVLKRNLGIKCALFTIDWLLGLGQGFLTQFQRIAWKLLRKLERSNLFLPVSPVSSPVRHLPHNPVPNPHLQTSYQKAIQNVPICELQRGLIVLSLCHTLTQTHTHTHTSYLFLSGKAKAGFSFFLRVLPRKQSLWRKTITENAVVYLILWLELALMLFSGIMFFHYTIKTILGHNTWE